jgi:hypothetical protein
MNRSEKEYNIEFSCSTLRQCKCIVVYSSTIDNVRGFLTSIGQEKARAIYARNIV